MKPAGELSDVVYRLCVCVYVCMRARVSVCARERERERERERVCVCLWVFICFSVRKKQINVQPSLASITGFLTEKELEPKPIIYNSTSRRLTGSHVNRPLYLLLSGFARGQALGCHAVARADRMQKSMQKHCRDTENDQSVVLNRRLPVSTFSPNHWSWRCHLLAPHWAEIDRLASGAERAREIKEKKQLAIADAGAAAAAAQSEGETSEELAEAGKQIEEHKKREEEMERLLASSNVGMPAQKLCLAYSLLRTWKETTISWGIHFWTNSVCRPVGSSLESVGYWVEGENPQPNVCCERGKRQEERERCWYCGRLAVVTLEDQLLVMTRLRIRLGWLQQELAYIFGVSEACVSFTFQEVD